MSEIFTPSNSPLDAVEDTKADLRAAIAEGLASLSDASETPTGVYVAPGNFTSSDIQFESDSWITMVNGLRGWLRVGDLSIASRSAFLHDLTRELNLEEDALEEVAGVQRLTLNGIQALGERISKAVDLQLVFQHELDDGASIAAATQTWDEAWDDALDEVLEPSAPEPVKARTEVYHIAQITTMKMNLAPSYQRGDVWTNTDRSALIESILRGIPLPSVILRKPTDSSTYEVVDGKQRLTSIFRFVGKHPVALKIVKEAQASHPDENLETLFSENYPQFKRVWKRVMGETLNAKQEDQYFFPFKLRSGQTSTLAYEPLTQLQGKYFTQIKDFNLGQDTVEELFQGGPEYKIPVIVYTSAQARQIHEVFKLYNKQGVHLNAEEIRNAVYHDVELTRAVLLSAGDADSHLPSKEIPPSLAKEIAPSVAGVCNLKEMAKDLSSYGLQEARYRRSKVLGWLIATLIRDPEGNFPSTATHINKMLEQLQKDKTNKLNNPNTLADLFEFLAHSIHVHAAHDELWDDKFKGNGTKWNDLQLIGSLLGVALATLMHPDDIDELLDSHADEILEASLGEAWQRPAKTQTKEQWAYIARIALGVLMILDVDPVAASQRVRDRFGSSGLDRLNSLTTATTIPGV